MAQEYEVLFADINHDEIRAKLKKLGAKKDFTKTFQRLNFEYPDWRLDKKDSWIRLQDEGDKINLAFKKRLGPAKGENGDDLGMEEIEFEISDYKKAKEFFLAIGFVVKFEFEKRRERWILDEIQFDLDEYPLIPPLLEIESSSWKKVDKGVELLKLDKSKKRICTAYQIYLDNDINPQDFIVVKFDEQIKRNKEKNPPKALH